MENVLGVFSLASLVKGLMPSIISKEKKRSYINVPAVDSVRAQPPNCQDGLLLIYYRVIPMPIL